MVIIEHDESFKSSIENKDERGSIFTPPNMEENSLTMENFTRFKPNSHPQTAN
jgi:hypothetical protein